MDEAFIGTVLMFAGTFAPKNWAFCNGALLPIMQNQALYSLLGTNYGGDGVTTFGLPNLCGRLPVGAGPSAAPTPIVPAPPTHTLGEKGGAAQVTLTSAQLPVHTHVPLFSTDKATTATPSAATVLAQAAGEVSLTTDEVNVFAYGESANLVAGNPAGIGSAGQGQAFDNMPPFLGMNYIICVNGLYPERP